MSSEGTIWRQFRTWIGFWAVVGVLLHAGLVVRHHASMVSAKLAHQDLITSLSIICHSDGTTSKLAASEIPNIPEPTGNSGDCPMCSGMGLSGCHFTDARAFSLRHQIGLRFVLPL